MGSKVNYISALFYFKCVSVFFNIYSFFHGRDVRNDLDSRKRDRADEDVRGGAFTSRNVNVSSAINSGRSFGHDDRARQGGVSLSGDNRERGRWERPTSRDAEREQDRDRPHNRGFGGGDESQEQTAKKRRLLSVVS